MLTVSELFDLEHTLAAPLLRGARYPWEILGGLSDIILALGDTLPAALFRHPAPGVWIANDATVAPTAFIAAPCVIDSGAEIRHGAFIRGSALIGKGAVVGNSCEIKNAVLFDGAQVPHFN